MIGKKAFVVSKVRGSSSTLGVFKRNEVFVLSDKIDSSAQTYFGMNPLTGFGIINLIKRTTKSDALIITAGATKMAKILTNLALKEKLTPIIIVRNDNTNAYY